MLYAAIALFILIVGLLLSRYIGIKKITYQRYFSQKGVYEGESVLLIEEIHNNFMLPLFRVDVEAFLSNELRLPSYAQQEHSMQYFISRFYLMPYTKIRRSIPVSCTRRGYYALDTVTIYFMRSSIYLKSKAEIYVYPRALSYDESNPLENDIQNTAYAEKRLLQDPFSLSGIRDYQHGDPFRSINFKATAKTGALKVNNRDFLSSQNFMIYIDFHMADDYEALPTEVYNELMETALSYAADRMQKAVISGYGAGFAANCKLLNGAGFIRFPVGRGQDHYREILKEMATIRILAGHSFTWLLQQDLDNLWNVEIFIMTVNMSTRLNHAIEVFKNRGNHVSVVNLREALQIDYEKVDG